MRATSLGAIIALALVCAACSGDGGSAQTLADTTTKAVYANDYDSVVGNADDAIKASITRAEIGTLSDKMHALGAYKGLTLVASDPVKNEFTYRADFDTGAMNVVVRVDADGKLAAYRVFPSS